MKIVQFVQIVWKSIKKCVAFILLGFLRIYQRFISPCFPRRCKYLPTCSQYAVLAIQKYGPFKGTIKAVWRLLRCNPFAKGGVDYP